MPSQLRMPRLSETTNEATVVNWLKKEGDRLRPGDPLVVVEVDKTSQEICAETEGVLARVLAAEGALVAVGQALALVATGEEDAARAAAAGAATTGPAQGGPPIQPGEPRRQRRPVSPAARRLAQELGVDLAAVAGSGAGGLVTEKDVRAAAERREEPVRAGQDWIPYTGTRRSIGERLSLSRRTAADVTTVAEVDMGAVADLRRGLGISYTAFVAAATAAALRKFPYLNSRLEGDRILLQKEVNLGVAVAVEHALLVPVVRKADRLTCGEISREIDRLALKARETGLSPQDVSGGTFTVTNSGAFGSLMFTPIINYPESAILGMGKVMDTAVVREGQVVARPMMYLCLTYDHRIVDGAVAVQFLQQIKRLLEESAPLLVERRA